LVPRKAVILFRREKEKKKKTENLGYDTWRKEHRKS